MEKLNHVPHISKISDKEKRLKYNISEIETEEFNIPILYQSEKHMIDEGYVSKDCELYKKYSDINYFKNNIFREDSYIDGNQIVFKVSIQNDHSHQYRSSLAFDLSCFGWKIVSKKYEDNDKEKRQKTYRIEFAGHQFIYPGDEHSIFHVMSCYLNIF